LEYNKEEIATFATVTKIERRECPCVNPKCIRYPVCIMKKRIEANDCYEFAEYFKYLHQQYVPALLVPLREDEEEELWGIINTHLPNLQVFRIIPFIFCNSDKIESDK